MRIFNVLYDFSFSIQFADTLSLLKKWKLHIFSAVNLKRCKFNSRRLWNRLIVHNSLALSNKMRLERFSLRALSQPVFHLHHLSRRRNNSRNEEVKENERFLIMECAFWIQDQSQRDKTFITCWLWMLCTNRWNGKFADHYLSTLRAHLIGLSTDDDFNEFSFSCLCLQGEGKFNLMDFIFSFVFFHKSFAALLCYTRNFVKDSSEFRVFFSLHITFQPAIYKPKEGERKSLSI